jgi:hypothetical protein
MMVMRLVHPTFPAPSAVRCRPHNTYPSEHCSPSGRRYNTSLDVSADEVIE